MKNLKLILGFALAALVMGQAHAVLINGEINFTGLITWDSGDPATATSITGLAFTTVTGTSGDYNAFAFGTPVTFTTPINMGAVGTTGALAIAPLWDLGGGTSFDLGSITINALTGSQRNLEGNGIAHMSGFDSTDGHWALSSSGNFSFSSATTVPDSGATAALLGLGLLGLAGAARRFKK